MAYVRVEQRNAHLAGAVRLETVKGRDGQIAKATLTAISNTRRGQRRQPRGGGHRDPVDAVGQAGRERRRVPGQGQPRQHRRAGCSNNNYDKDGETVYGLAFTAEEIDYLDSQGRVRGAARKRRTAPRRAMRRAGNRPHREAAQPPRAARPQPASPAPSREPTTIPF